MNKYKVLQDELWSYAETGMLEYKSSEAMIKFLENEGFNVERNVADMETAFIASYGHGKPVIAFLAEYDALFGMNQKEDILECSPITNSEDPGHGCGHHLLAVGSIKAACLYKDYLINNHKEGTVLLVGCPAEESGSGKAYLARDGYFDNVDIALTWHPSNYNMVSTGSSQSCISVFFKFHGISSHAAGAPHLGRSALDACELMNVGVNYLREHMESTDRVHYAYTNAGGKAPNVVQSEACLKYFIRSTTNPKCIDLYKRVINIAKGAALMTDTKLDVIFDEGLSNVINNFTLEDVLSNSFKKVYNISYTPEEIEYANNYKNTYDINNTLNNLPDEIIDKPRLIKNIKEKAINDYFVETKHSNTCSMGSTDVGDISWVVPCAQINTACFSIGASGHTWQWVAQGKSTIALKGAMMAGEILSDAAVTLLNNPELITKAKAEFKERLNGYTYECLIPKDVKPHVSKAD